jgi:ubiquinone/menaquinone biosynthesis C-methylase UbiE
MTYIEADTHKNDMQIYSDERRQCWEENASTRNYRSIFSKYYQHHLESTYRFLVTPGLSILELGCGMGDLLSSLQPSRAVGVDFSQAMIQKAAEKYPHIEFHCADVHNLGFLTGPFDIIILSDLINDLWDIQKVLSEIFSLCTSRTRIILNFYSRMWQYPLMAGKAFHLAKPTLYQNWLTKEDVINLLNLAGFDPIRVWNEFLFPLPIPIIKDFFNRFLVRLWPFNLLACANFLVARPNKQPEVQNPSVSVIIPARNEAGNIVPIFDRVPSLGSFTELVFIEGGSTDHTYEAIQQVIASHPVQKCILLNQTGTGKGQAVRQGFASASGDILMILDADLTVLPEDLPRFYEAILTGKGELINGVRMVYPMQKEAMRFLNFLGNKFFSLAFSWLLGQPIKDTLCGTKVLWKKDYQLIAANSQYFGDFDPFGDFDLLFGAAKINLRLIDLPIRYKERVYGQTNIHRWKHGWLLLKMVFFAATRIKFI